MRIRSRALALGTVAALMLASPVFAHHSWPVDRTTVATVRGTVTEFDWSSPHVEIALDVKDENGNVEKWIVGGPSTFTMAIRGWDADSLQPGDMITAVGFQAVDGSNLMRVKTIALAEGQELLVYGDC